MSYVSDWEDAERAWQEAHDAHPEREGCTGKRDCPNDEHWGTCGRQRRIWYPELYARLDAERALREVAE